MGEIQALSLRTSWQGQDLLVSYLPEFIAKTDTEAYRTPREFRIKSLATIVGEEDEERFICPVRALSLYLHRTASDTRPRNLFLAVKCPSRPMSKAAISVFLRNTVKSPPDSTCPEIKVRTHDIRSIAASMLMWKNCSVTSILRAARSNTQFLLTTIFETQ